MNDTLMLITKAFIQYGRDHDLHGLIDMCVDPDDGYFSVRMDDVVYTRINADGNIMCRKFKETDTTEE